MSLYLFQNLLVRHYTLAFHANLKAFVKSTSGTMSSTSLLNLTLVIVRTGKFFLSFYRTAKEALEKKNIFKLGQLTWYGCGVSTRSTSRMNKVDSVKQNYY